VQRISGLWSRLLSLGGELFNARLWRCNHVAFMEIAGTTRGRRRITDVRRIDRDDFCRHSAFDSDSICGAQRLSGHELPPRGRAKIHVHPENPGYLADSKQSAHWLLELKRSLANCDWYAIISDSSDVSRDVIREERRRKLRECGARLVSDLGS
jgi:hypothetical protein